MYNLCMYQRPDTGSSVWLACVMAPLIGASDGACIACTYPSRIFPAPPWSGDAFRKIW